METTIFVPADARRNPYIQAFLDLESHDVSYELEPQDNSYKDHLSLYDRYVKSRIYSKNFEKFFETWDIPEVPVFPDDTYHRIDVGEIGRWDLISYQYYQTVVLWWVICLANGIRNPLEVRPAGSMLRIPSLSSLVESGFLSWYR